MGFSVVQVGNLTRKQSFLEKTTAFKDFVFTELLPNPRLWAAHGSLESLSEASGPQSLEALGLKADHMRICSAAASPAPEQTSLRVTIPLPELLKHECSWLQGSCTQQLCLRKGGSGSCLQPPREINVFEYRWSQESFQLDCRKLNKSWILIRIQTSWIKIRNYPARLCLVCGTLSIKCLGFLQNWKRFCQHIGQDYQLVLIQVRAGYFWYRVSYM